jgi:VanZ family protein
MKKILVYWESAAWSIFMLVLFLTPSRGLPSVHIPYQDKFAHIGLFAVFSILYLRGRLKSSSLKTFVPGQIITTFVIVMVFAVLVEILQDLMHAGRDGDISDALHDFAGFLCGSLFMVLIYGIRPRAL